MYLSVEQQSLTDVDKENKILPPILLTITRKDFIKIKQASLMSMTANFSLVIKDFR